MISIDSRVNQLHAAYCSAMDLQLPLSLTHERWYMAALEEGLTPEDFGAVVTARVKFNRTSAFKKGIMIHHFVRSEEDIAVTMNEVAVIRASKRIKVMDPNRASVLRASGRPDTVLTGDAVHVGDVKLIQDLRKAAS